MVSNNTQFFSKLKVINNHEINKNKILKRQNFQKNKLYKMAILNFFENNYIKNYFTIGQSMSLNV